MPSLNKLIKTILILSSISTTLAYSKTELSKLEEIFESVAKKQEVPVELLKSICWAESTWNETSYVYNDGKEGNSAYGICQVLFKTALDLGMKAEKGCNRDYRNKNVVRSPKNCSLFGPRKNITYAAKMLKMQLNRYDDSEISAVAAYNAGSVITCKTGKVRRARDNKVIGRCHKGGLLNEGYINRVMEILESQEYVIK